MQTIEVDELGERESKRSRLQEEIRANHMSPPGVLNLPPLLEERRLSVPLPDHVFRVSAMFDRVYLWKLGNHESETYAGTQIVRPETDQLRDEKMAPRGMIVSAGLSAMDALVSNGCGLGHIVKFNRHVAALVSCGFVGPNEITLLEMAVGNITGSEDLGPALLNGDCRIEFNSDPKVLQHEFVDQTGRRWNPQKPYDYLAG